MVLHGSWNGMAVLAATKQPYFLLYGYFAVFMPIFFGMVGFVLWLRSVGGPAGRAGAAGLRRAPAGSPRPRWPRWAPSAGGCPPGCGRARVAGDAGLAAMRAYQFAATRLALVRDGLNRGLYRRPADLDRAVTEERRLLEAVDAYRRVFVGRDPVAPRRAGTAALPDPVPGRAVRAVAAPARRWLPVPVSLAGAPAVPVADRALPVAATG